MGIEKEKKKLFSGCIIKLLGVATTSILFPHCEDASTDRPVEF